MLHRSYRTFVLTAAASTVATALVVAAPALAEIRHISTTGKNTNPCTLAQPCRTLQYGINHTAAGGELHVLDSGFYGNNAKVNRAMTINGNGHTVMVGTPLTVNAPGGTVFLRRLVLNGEGGSQRGIEIAVATAVHIDHCVVQGFTATCIRLNGANVNVFVTDSIVRDNGSEGLNATGSGAAKLTVENSRFEGNGGIGIYAQTIESSITRSVSSGNGSNGIHALGGRMNVTSTTSAGNFHGFVVAFDGQMVLESSVSRGNSSIGAYAFDGTITISNSVFTHNGTGINKPAAGTVLTRQNNVITGNTTNTVGALTPLGGL